MWRKDDDLNNVFKRIIYSYNVDKFIPANNQTCAGKKKRSNYTTMLNRRIKSIAIEVFKSLHDLNPNFIKEMFIIKELKYSLRHSNIIYQLKFEKVTYGKNTFKYYGSHILNFLQNDIKETADILSFKSLIMTWESPKCQCNMCNILILICIYDCVHII